MGFLDWIVVVVICLASVIIGLIYTRGSSSKGSEGYFTGGRGLPWWAVGISNSATYQSGMGGFVMLIFLWGLAGNWLWWAQWIIWMPLVAVIWARMWRRLQIVTTAELISIRYHGRMARYARWIYAFSMFGLVILLIAYITGFFAKTIAPLVPMSEFWILVIFGSLTVLYTMFGGLKGSVMVAVFQMVIMLTGSLIYLLLIIPDHGGWAAVLEAVRQVRPDTLSLSPLSHATPPLTLLMFIVLGFFFAGSPTAGEGMTAQRFMAARSERHAIAGQLFNALIALSLRIVPLVGMGILTISVFWCEDLVAIWGPAPEGYVTIDDPAYAWGELIRRSTLPIGFVGLLVATEVAAFMSTLSALINWGSSFIVNDFYRDWRPDSTPRMELWISRLTTLVLFLVAAVVVVLYVDDMMDWFLFINSIVVIFWLPLAYFRFFWERFNIWGELAATVFGLPMAILVWFVLGFKDQPYWISMGMLFSVALAMIVIATLLTPAEPRGIREAFYRRCRPMMGWKQMRKDVPLPPNRDPSIHKLFLDSIMGMLACGGLAIATNAIFVGNYMAFVIGGVAAVAFGGLMIHRCVSGPVDANGPVLHEEGVAVAAEAPPATE